MTVTHRAADLLDDAQLTTLFDRLNRAYPNLTDRWLVGVRLDDALTSGTASEWAEAMRSVGLVEMSHEFEDTASRLVPIVRSDRPRIDPRIAKHLGRLVSKPAR